MVTENRVIKSPPENLCVMWKGTISKRNGLSSKYHLSEDMFVFRGVCVYVYNIYIYIIFLFAYCKQWVKELLQGSCCGLWILLVGGPTKSTFSKGRAIHNSQHHCLAMHLPQFISLPPQQKLFKVLGKPFGKPKKQQTKLWFSNYSDLWTS